MSITRYQDLESKKDHLLDNPFDKRINTWG